MKFVGNDIHVVQYDKEQKITVTIRDREKKEIKLNSSDKVKMYVDFSTEKRDISGRVSRIKKPVQEITAEFIQNKAVFRLTDAFTHQEPGVYYYDIKFIRDDSITTIIPKSRFIVMESVGHEERN